jgi:hypothetical protein
MFILLGCLPWLAADAADTGFQQLQNNPFTRPEVLKPKPPPPPAPRPVVVVPPEEVELDLTATMVSDTRPMVMVDGELLGIGEKIQGLKLIAVMEGKAVFARGARKYSFEINQGQRK